MRLYLSARSNDGEMWQRFVRLQVDAGDVSGAQKSLSQLRSTQPLAAVLAAADIRRERVGSEAAIEVITASGLDPSSAANAPLLEALVGDQIAVGSPERGLAQVDAALTRRPDDPALHVLRGKVLAAQGKTVEASAAFERSLTLEADNPDAIAGGADLAAERGDLGDAIARLERALAADPTSADLARRAAELAGRQDEPALEIEKLERLLRIAPTDANASRRLALLLVEDARERDRALKYAERAVALGRRSDSLEALARVQLASGNGKTAVETLREALEKDPERASARYWLGRALEAEGDEEGARAAYEEAIRGAPSPERDRAREALAALTDARDA
jgi:tetratricopeptide (TPR) repeat protein